MIHVHNLTKRYGTATVVDGLTFTVHPGMVTGFLGPNGAGKSTTMRMILDLTSPTFGTATINGRRYRAVCAPARGRCAPQPRGSPPRAHRPLPPAVAGPRRRTTPSPSRRGPRTSRFGLRRRQTRRRLLPGHAPTSGHRRRTPQRPSGAALRRARQRARDPEGIRWIRGLLRELATAGRTVLVSSHLIHEIQAIADHVIIIGRGRLLADVSMAELTARGSSRVRVAASDTGSLTAALTSEGATVHPEDGALLVSGLRAARIGKIALRYGITLRELTPQRTSLEEVFMHLTAASTAHRSGSTPVRARSQA